MTSGAPQWEPRDPSVWITPEPEPLTEARMSRDGLLELLGFLFLHHKQTHTLPSILLSDHHPHIVVFTVEPQKCTFFSKPNVPKSLSSSLHAHKFINTSVFTPGCLDLCIYRRLSASLPLSALQTSTPSDSEHTAENQPLTAAN